MLLLKLKPLILFFITALMEILGCYLPYLWLRHKASPFLLMGGVLCLMLFVYLLSLHPVASGRVYASYGGVYIIMSLLWLRFVDKVALSPYDAIGALVVLIGVLIILKGW